MKFAKVLFSLILTAVLCAGLFVPVFEAAYSYNEATYFETGDYAMVLTEIDPNPTPDTYGVGSYYMKNVPSQKSGFTFEWYGSAESATYWRITKVSSF